MKKKKALKKSIKKAAAPKKKKVQATKKKTPVKAKKTAAAKKKTPALKSKPTGLGKKIVASKAKKQVATKKNLVATPSKAVKEVKAEVKISASGRIKVQFEYYTRSSVGVLYNSFSNASGLSAWFADNVQVNGNVYTFSWDGSQESAYILDKKEDEYTRFRWSYQPDDCYFEFRIKIDSITNEVALVITDFVEKGEEKELKLLWDSQVHELMHILGS